MSVEAAEVHGHHGPPHLCHQFQDMEQQNDSYVIGMWTFLVTEIMFFGALFLCYVVYRGMNPAVFVEAHHHLEIAKGATNTVVLLTSSFTMAMTVYYAQMANRNRQLVFLAVTILLAFVFLGIKGLEWYKKWEDHHVPGPNFSYVREGLPAESGAGAANTSALNAGAAPGEGSMAAKNTVEPIFAQKAELFFSLYFAMTGLHALHIIIGIGIMGVMWLMLLFRHPAVDYHMPIEMAGLYWHFVDIVWIFLFPLFYLIPGKG